MATGAVGRLLNRRDTEHNRSWFRFDKARVVNAATKETDTEVWIYDEIGYWGVTAQDFARELQEVDSDTITLRLNSPGGEVYDGIAIMNALIDHKAKVTVKVDALAASIASVIAMAGDTVIMGSHSEFMIHDASTIAMGNAADIREVAEMLDRISANIADVYAERSGGKAEDWRALMLAETWFSAEEAVTAGLADKVAPKPSKRDPEDDEGTAEDRALAVVSKWDLSNFKFSGRRQAGAPDLGRVIRAGGASKKVIPDVEETAPEDETEETEAESCEHAEYEEGCAACDRKKAEADDVEDDEPLDFKALFSSSMGAALAEVDANTEGIDSETFHHAVKSVTDAAVPLPARVAVVPTAAPTSPVFPADSLPDPGEELRQIFRSAVELAANDAPAPTLAQPESNKALISIDPADLVVIDPVEFYNSLREAINQ